MTAPRLWPNVARELRDRAAEYAISGIQALEPIVEGQSFDRTETLRRQSVALKALIQIARCMEGAGAPTRPDIR